MSGTYEVSVGDRGRVVLPAQLRDRAGLTEGTALVLIESPDGIVVLTQAQLKDRIRQTLNGPSLVEALLDQRRREASRDDPAGTSS